jgi:hypothetical protein
MKTTQLAGLLATTLAILPALSAAARFNTTTIINSNCPCDRSRFKYCYHYTRQGVKDNACYAISEPSWSMRVYDPRMSIDNRVVCLVFTGMQCDGKQSPMVGWMNNTRCMEPTMEVNATEVEVDGKNKKGQVTEDVAWWYQSFKCHHPRF